MDGFYTTDGISGDGLLHGEPSCRSTTACSTSSRSAATTSARCSGPTWPNRFYFAAGTSGGITTNGVWGYGVFDYPIILDLLDAAGVTWKVYNNTLGQRPLRQHRQRLRLLEALRPRQAHARHQGRLLQRPQARDASHRYPSIIPSFARGRDEHPPADVSVGMGIQEDYITALRQSPIWEQIRVHPHL